MAAVAASAAVPAKVIRPPGSTVTAGTANGGVIATGDVTVRGDGPHTVRVRAIDRAGNVGEVRPLSVGIDAAAPVTRATFDSAARTVTLTAADAGSGVATVEYRLGAGQWTTYAAPVGGA